MDGASFKHRTRCNRTATGLDRLLFQIFYPFGYVTAARSTDALQGLLALTIHGTSQKVPDFRPQVSWIVAWLAFDLGKVRGASNIGGLSDTE